jgi:hypothetical protein
MQVAEPLAAWWKAQLALEFQRVGEKTILAKRASEGPLVVQKPLYPEGAQVCHAIVVHPPGGISAQMVRLDVRAGRIVCTDRPVRWCLGGRMGNRAFLRC